jgi:hypothetical protein
MEALLNLHTSHGFLDGFPVGNALVLSRLAMVSFPLLV